MYLRAGQAEVVEEPPWCSCQGGEDVTSGALKRKGSTGHTKWALQQDSSFLSSLQEKASFGERIGYTGHHQEPAPHGRSSWVVIMILISQKGGKLRRDSTQFQKPLHGASLTKVHKAGLRLEVLCKGVILSCPVQSQQTYLPFPPLPSPTTTHHGKLHLGKPHLGAQPR